MTEQVNIKQLYSFDKDKIIKHLLSLSPKACYNRFCSNLGKESIIAYVEKINFRDDGVFGFFDDNLDIIGFAHMPINKNSSELGISVLDDYQGRGIGKAILQRVNTFAKAKGISEIYLYCLPDNKEMMHLAQKFDLVIRPQEDCGVVRVPTSGPFDALENDILNNAAEFLHSQKVFLRSFFPKTKIK